MSRKSGSPEMHPSAPLSTPVQLLPPQERESINRTLQTFHPFQDRILSGMEFVIIFLIGLIIIFAILSYMFQMFGITTIFGLTIYKLDFGNILSKVNQNWHIGFTILLPLFFRPIRSLLERVRKIGPLDIEPPEDTKTVPNQPQRN